MLAFVAPLLAFLTVPNGEGDELAAMRAAVEAGLPSTAAGPQRESRSSSICSDTPGWTNPHGFGCSVYDVYWCAGGKARPGQAWTLGKVFEFPEAHCCACGKGELDDIYRQRATPAVTQGAYVSCSDRLADLEATGCANVCSDQTLAAYYLGLGCGGVGMRPCG